MSGVSEVWDWVGEQIDRGMRSRYWGEEGPVLDGAELEWDLDEVLQAAEAAQFYSASAAEVARALKQQAAAMFEARGGSAYRRGGFIYRYQPKRTLRVSDPRRLVEYLGDDLAHVVRIDGSNVRKTGLAAVAEARGSDPRVLFDTFLFYEEGPPSLQSMPVEKAPKFLQDMEDGELR